VILTEWPDFATLDWPEVSRRMRTPLLVDLRNLLDPETVGAAGIAYRSLGRASRIASRDATAFALAAE
jgi:UDPglucose 6-dehydrogenase